MQFSFLLKEHTVVQVVAAKIDEAKHSHCLLTAFIQECILRANENSERARLWLQLTRVVDSWFHGVQCTPCIVAFHVCTLLYFRSVNVLLRSWKGCWVGTGCTSMWLCLALMCKWYARLTKAGYSTSPPACNGILFACKKTNSICNETNSIYNKADSM